MEKLKTLLRKMAAEPLWTYLTLLWIFIAVSIAGGFIWVLLEEGEDWAERIVSYMGVCIYGPVLLGIFVLGPGLLSAYNLFYLFSSTKSEVLGHAGRKVEYVTILFGAVCTMLWGAVRDIRWTVDWWEQLYSFEHHTPVATWTWPTVAAVAAVAFVGYLILRLRRGKAMPPLALVLCLGCLYLGMALCTVWIVQVVCYDWVLCVYPANLILIFLKLVHETARDWIAREEQLPRQKLAGLFTFTNRAVGWPILAAVPLLGVLVAVLVLFGQEPDAIIQAWTQTSDWTLSQQVAPQDLPYDGHYLCTVAAGGHRRLVKPQRMGLRHGHRVLVNRQLCVANAFEQLLQERLPRLHRAVRYVYDRYGYPVAKHIRSAWTADAVWLLMKPLEWIFLAVLYLWDEKPENRIAVQYPHSPVPKL